MIVEKNNICNMQCIATINIVRSADTQFYYYDAITHCGEPLDGYWITGNITRQQVDEIIDIIKNNRGNS